MFINQSIKFKNITFYCSIISLLLFHTALYGNSWNYNIKDTLVLENSSSIMVEDSVVISYLNEIDQKIISHKNNQKDLKNRLSQLINILNSCTNKERYSLLYLKALSYALASKLDFIGSKNIAISYFNQLTSHFPMNSELQLQYGYFLFSTKKNKFLSLRPLEKALLLGEVKALYPIGEIYRNIGFKDKATTLLNEYHSKFPNYTNKFIGLKLN